MRTYVRNIIMEKCNKNIRLIYYNQNHRTLHSKQHLCILHLCNFFEYAACKKRIYVCKTNTNATWIKATCGGGERKFYAENNGKRV